MEHSKYLAREPIGARWETVPGMFYITSLRNVKYVPYIYLRVSTKLSDSPKTVGISGVKYPGLKKNIRKDEKAYVLDVDFYPMDEALDFCVGRSHGGPTELIQYSTDKIEVDDFLPWDSIRETSFYWDPDTNAIFFKKNPHSSLHISSGQTHSAPISDLFLPLTAIFYYQGRDVWSV